MPSKQSGKKSGEKRKVISPLENTQDSGQTGSNRKDDQQTDGAGSDGVHTKRLHFCYSPTYIPDSYIDLNNMANYQQLPFSPQNQQTPQGFVGQYQPAPPAPPPIPPWAAMMMEDIKVIRQDIDKIHQIEKTVNTIHNKLSDLEIKVTGIDGRIEEVEKSCSFINSEIESKTREIKKAKEEISDLQKQRSDLESRLNQLDTDLKNVNSKMSEAESRSMKNNLVFFGVEENGGENCETEIKKVINENLQIDSTNMMIDRVHRMGGAGARKPRPIVACFHYYKDRETIRAKAYDLNDALKQAGYGISIQRPRQIRDARKALYNVMKQERDKGKRVKFVGDKLYINEVLYVPPE